MIFKSLKQFLFHYQFRHMVAMILVTYSSLTMAMFCPVVPDNFKIILSGDSLNIGGK